MTAVNSRRPKDPDGTGGQASELETCLPFFPEPDLIAVALAAGQIGVWSWDLRTQRASLSTNLAEIYGLSTDALDGSTMILQSHVHPEDQPAVFAAVRDVLQTRNPRRVQYRLPPQPGADERWIEALAAVVVE